MEVDLSAHRHKRAFTEPKPRQYRHAQSLSAQGSPRPTRSGRSESSATRHHTPPPTSRSFRQNVTTPSPSPARLLPFHFPSSPVPIHQRQAIDAASNADLTPSKRTTMKSKGRTSKMWRYIPKVQLAKQHLQQLELLWGEVAGVPMSGDSTPPSETPEPRMRPESVASMASVAQSILGLEENPFDMKKQNRRSLESSDKAMAPIVDALERLIAEEMERRKAVEDEIQELKKNIREKCEILDEPVRFYINADTASKKLTIFQCRDALSAKLILLETLLRDRKSILDNLVLRINECKKDLADLEDDEFSMYSPEALTSVNIRALSDTIEALESEYTSRRNRLLKRFYDLACIKDQMGYVLQANHDPSASVFEGDALDSLLDAILAANPEKNSSDSSKRDSWKVKSVEIEEIMDATLLSSVKAAIVLSRLDEPDKETIVSPFNLTRKCERCLATSVAASRAELDRKLERCQQLIKEIRIFWTDLGIPKHHENVQLTEDVKLLNEYEAVANELRVRWRQKMEEAMNKRMERLKALWMHCHIGSEETERFLVSISENYFSPLTLELIEAEILKLEERLKREKPILDMINERYAFIQKLKDFEKSASDPQRLFQPSFRLMEEEKFRKTGVPTLLNKEEKLKKAIATFEQIGERFVNEALVVFDSTLAKSPLHRQTSHGNLNQSPKVARQSPLVARGDGKHIAQSAPSSPTLRRARSTSSLKQERKMGLSRPPSAALEQHPVTIRGGSRGNGVAGTPAVSRGALKGGFSTLSPVREGGSLLPRFTKSSPAPAVQLLKRVEGGGESSSRGDVAVAAETESLEK
ncbi:hypothetical protein HDU97_005061 [Phlyctochytrium planicorne]|nr:hypothetical protein HDU97_005061 [Phlyctochytrium planicorne]